MAVRVDEASIRDIPGAKVVHIKDFLADSEGQNYEQRRAVRQPICRDEEDRQTGQEVKLFVGHQYPHLTPSCFEAAVPAAPLVVSTIDVVEGSACQKRTAVSSVTVQTGVVVAGYGIDAVQDVSAPPVPVVSRKDSMVPTAADGPEPQEVICGAVFPKT